MKIQKEMETHKKLILPVLLILLASFLATSASLSGKNTITGAVTGIPIQYAINSPTNPPDSKCQLYNDPEVPNFFMNGTNATLAFTNKNGDQYCKSKGYKYAGFTVLKQTNSLLDSNNGICNGKVEVSFTHETLYPGKTILKEPIVGSYCSTLAPTNPFVTNPTTGDNLVLTYPTSIYCCN